MSYKEVYDPAMTQFYHDAIRRAIEIFPYESHRYYGVPPLGRKATDEEKQRIAIEAIAFFEASDVTDAHKRTATALAKANRKVMCDERTP